MDDKILELLASLHAGKYSTKLIKVSVEFTGYEPLIIHFEAINHLFTDNLPIVNIICNPTTGKCEIQFSECFSDDSFDNSTEHLRCLRDAFDNATNLFDKLNFAIKER